MTMRTSILASLVISMIWLGGCSSAAQQSLRQGTQALEEKNYDDASEYASEVLGTVESGPVRAEALYLRGRSFEGRAAETPNEMAWNLKAARIAYTEGLKNTPGKKLESYLHTSLGKVCFFQEDYAAAEQELRIAYDHADSDEQRQPILFFMARAQQRRANFRDADVNFGLLIEQHPQSDWAKKAQEVRGARAFYVQLGAYSSAANADAAAVALRRRGVNPIRLIDSRGRQLLRTGPCATYDQANQLRKRLADAYPGAIIVP